MCDVVQEEAAKGVLAEFNLGCDVEHTQHVYRVYVTTFLGFGGNMARQRYEDRLLNSTVTKNRYAVGGESGGSWVARSSLNSCRSILNG